MAQSVWQDLLIPPKSVRTTGAYFQWPADAVTIALWDLADEPAAQLLVHALKEQGVAAELVFGNHPDATICLHRALQPIAEGYRLEVTPATITITGDDAGRLYGAATLTEAIERNGLAALPTVEIEDSPDFGRRALYFDCSRGKVPRLETLVQLIPMLARWRINELQLYVEDVFTFAGHPAIGKDSSPFTPLNLLQIQEACRRWHVDFVPSLASFGHMEKILALKPYRHLGEKPGTYGHPGGTTLCPLDPGAIELVAELYDDFLPLFAAKDFNACGDEPWELGKGRCADVTGGVGAVYHEFLGKLREQTQRHGKRLNLWADIILNYPERLKDVPKDLVLLNWDYEPDAARAARSEEIAAAGLEFLVCPGTHCWKSHGTRLQTAVTNVRRCAEEARRWGAVGLMNTNWGDAGHRNPLAVSLHGFAHGGAHAWNGTAVDDDSFTDRFCHWMAPAWRDATPLLTLLGQIQEQVKTEPYFATIQSFDPAVDLYVDTKVPTWSGVFWPPKFRRDWLGDGDPDAANRLRHEIAPLLDARGPERFPNFQREIVMAANLERYALGRIALAPDVRAGTLDPAARRTLHADGQAVIGEFSSCWRQRNRPSRLRDNLRLLKAALAELE
jgi:hypothetical protein